jgi:hypothetical protein
MEDMIRRFLAYNESNLIKEFGRMCIMTGRDYGIGKKSRKNRLGIVIRKL